MFLDVGAGHRIFYEVVGAPRGKPIVVLHGGPGAPTSNYRDALLQLFDLRKWRILLWDQRGCGKSTGPLTEHNTTWDLVADMERLREEVLHVPRWTLFGGSWGSTLALAYVSKHLDRVAGMLLRGVSLLAPWENEWLYGPSGAARFFPEEYRKFTRGLKGTRGSTATIRAFKRRLTQRKARQWVAWESALSSLVSPSGSKAPSQKAIREMATLETHYFSHNAWITADQLLAAASRIPRSVPVYIVQGRFDMVCPPAAAISLAHTVPHAKIRLTLAGHAWSDPANTAALKEALAQLSQPRQ